MGHHGCLAFSLPVAENLQTSWHFMVTWHRVLTPSRLFLRYQTSNRFLQNTGRRQNQFGIRKQAGANILRFRAQIDRQHSWRSFISCIGQPVSHGSIGMHMTMKNGVHYGMEKMGCAKQELPTAK